MPSPPIETFFVFRSDRIFHIVIDERWFPWGKPAISVESLRELVQALTEVEIWLERKDASDLKLEPGATVPTRTYPSPVLSQ